MASVSAIRMVQTISFCLFEGIFILFSISTAEPHYSKIFFGSVYHRLSYRAVGI